MGAAISKVSSSDTTVVFIARLPGMRTEDGSLRLSHAVALPTPAEGHDPPLFGETAQQIVDGRLASRPGVDLLDDHRAVQRVRSVLRRQLPGHDHAVRRHAAVGDLAGGAVVDARGLAQ